MKIDPEEWESVAFNTIEKGDTVLSVYAHEDGSSVINEGVANTVSAGSCWYSKDGWFVAQKSNDNYRKIVKYVLPDAFGAVIFAVRPERGNSPTHGGKNFVHIGDGEWQCENGFSYTDTELMRDWAEFNTLSEGVV